MPTEKKQKVYDKEDRKEIFLIHTRKIPHNTNDDGVDGEKTE